MKLLAGLALFLLCALVGEGRARRLLRRERIIGKLHDLIQAIGDRQLTALTSFQEAALGCPPSSERALLLSLARGETSDSDFLTAEELAALRAYARSDSRSVSALRMERDALLAFLQKERDRTRQELSRKGQVYRSMGYLCGAAALLLVL